jgi:hypothetical protein
MDSLHCLLTKKVKEKRWKAQRIYGEKGKKIRKKPTDKIKNPIDDNGVRIKKQL